MSELKEHLFCECDEIFREYRWQLSNEKRPYYLKSEADKVIHIVERRECHQKYKRCLAMADYCYTNVHCIMGHRLCAFADWKKEWFERWHRRWLELAEKFKEAK